MIRDLIEQNVSIHQVLRDWFNLDVPEEQDWQISCPFGDEHAHGDAMKSVRVYIETNNIHCYTIHGSMNCVELVAKADNLTMKEAALKIVQRYDLNYKAPDYLKTYATASKKAREDPRAPASEALWTYAKTLGNQKSLLEAFLECLQELDNYMCGTWPDKPTDEVVRGWLEDSKRHIRVTADIMERVKCLQENP